MAFATLRDVTSQLYGAVSAFKLKVDMHIYSIASLINTVVLSSLGLFVYLKKPSGSVQRWWLGLNLFGAAWSFGTMLGTNSTDPIYTLFWFRVLNYFAIFIPFILINFAAVFIFGANHGIKFTKSSLIISIVIFLLSIFFPEHFIENVKKANFLNFTLKLGPFYHFFTLYFFGCVIYSLALLFRGYKRANGIKRNQLKYLFIGMLVAFTGGGSTFLMAYGYDIPNGNFYLSVYAIIMAYAIVNHRLMDIEVIVKKTVVFAGLFGMVMMTVTLVMAFTQGIASRYISVPPMVVTAIASLIVIGLYDPTRKLLVHITDRFLYQKKFDYRRLLKDASRGIALIQSLDRLARLIVTFLCLRARIKNAATLFSSSSGETLQLKAFRGYGKELSFDYRISFEHPLVKMLQMTHQPVRFSDLKEIKGTGSRELEIVRSEMKKLKAESIIPSFLGRNTTDLHWGARPALKSLLILGGKKSDTEYSDEDLAVFFTLAQEAAIAIENARLYDEAVKRSQELQHMNAKLDSATMKLTQSLKEAQTAKNELEENKAILVEMKRRENLQRLAASIGHELNNPLAVFNMQCIKFSRDIKKIESALDQIDSGEMNGSGETLEQVIEDEKALLGRFERFYERIRAVADTVDGLLKAGDRVAGVSLKMILDYSFEEVRFVTYAENLSETQIEFDVPNHLPPIKGNAFQLQAVFVNLIVNAYHALRDVSDRKISISAALESGGGMIRIVFKDNGCGMVSEVLEKCFDYQFTTRGEKGTGIGLTVCKQTIERHGGTLTVESKAGKGTVFTIRLPVWDEKAENASVIPAPNRDTRGQAPAGIQDDERFKKAA
ncbi:MAG: GHKL domain-containing protein [Candidatus Omnitrophica bacterium]|nr:GHKL domain-containing protein [Candidatus Omnitrophota bacterium]